MRHGHERVIWGSFKFFNAFGHSIRFTPTPSHIMRHAGSKMKIKPGALTIEMTRSSLEPIKMCVKPEMFAQFLTNGKSLFVIGSYDRRLYVSQFRQNESDYDCWKMFDTVSHEYVICGFDHTVLTQAKSLVTSLFYWCYGFHLLVPRKTDEKNSEVFVKHALIRDKRTQLECTFTPPRVKADGILCHGGIFLNFKERKASLDFQLSISDVSRLLAHDFEKSLELKNDTDIVLYSSYDSKSNVHGLTAQREKLRITFSLTSSEFQQLRWVLTTAIPVISGFDHAFEAATTSSIEMLRQDSGTSFLNFRSWKMHQRDHEFHA